MPSTDGFELLKEKVPDLKSTRGKILTGLYIVFSFMCCLLFFFWVDGLFIYGPVVSQLTIAIIGSFFSYGHFKTPARYRERYGELAYRYHFYHFMIPILVTWYACCFHPLLIGGPQILPWWLAIIAAIILFILVGLAEGQIEKAGFDVNTHGMDIFTIFPEETPPVYGEIYSFIRHPLYFALMCISFAVAIFRNNVMAILVAITFLVPLYVGIYLEDRELIERYGDTHREYIKKTGALMPKKPLGFLKILVNFKGKDENDERMEDSK
ncbi:MAG: methyltransferase [Candidatus Thorarchaeota archaeon]